MSLEERLMKYFQMNEIVIPEEVKMGITFMLGFTREEIIRALEEVVPETGDKKEFPIHSHNVMRGGWDNCRKEILNKIEEIKKELE